MEKALFITLDDTLIFTKSGQKYPIHSRDWIINIDLFPIIKSCYKEDYKIIIIDNQESVAHGYVDIKVFDNKITEILETLEIACNLKTNSVCYTFWTGDRDEYYKLPNPGLIYDCALEYELDIPNSILICNSDEDYLLAFNSGIKTCKDVNKING